MNTKYTLAERQEWAARKRERKAAKNARRRFSACHSTRAKGLRDGSAYVCSTCGRVEKA